MKWVANTRGLSVQTHPHYLNLLKAISLLASTAEQLNLLWPLPATKNEIKVNAVAPVNMSLISCNKASASQINIKLMLLLSKEESTKPNIRGRSKSSGYQ